MSAAVLPMASIDLHCGLRPVSDSARRHPLWRRAAVLITAILGLLGILPTGASAHPMGNFTVNRYARLEPGDIRLELVYIVDFAEIPTFQELGRDTRLSNDLDPQALSNHPAARELEQRLTAEWAAGLRVTAQGKPVSLATHASQLEFLPGVGGLPTMKLRLQLEGTWPSGGEVVFDYNDTNAPERLGWREIVVRPAHGIDLLTSTVPSTDRSNELTSYPVDGSVAFPQDIIAQVRLKGVVPPPGAGSGPSARSAEASTAAVGTGAAQASSSSRRDGLADLIAQPELTPTLIAFSLVVAFCLGGLHALSPGHGKTMVAAYLVGARGTPMHAVLLGGIVTAAHTIGVFLLGIVTLLLSAHIVPEHLYPIIQMISGVTIMIIGGTMFVRRLRHPAVHGHHHGPGGEHIHEPRNHHHHDGHDEDHDHDHGHDHAHGHSHSRPTDAPTMRTLLALGISGGILPCPSALVVLLSAIALHRVGFGIVLIVAFSLGLASVLTAVGILVVRATTIFTGFKPMANLARRVPVFSALCVGILGLGLVASALPEVRALF